MIFDRGKYIKFGLVMIVVIIAGFFAVNRVDKAIRNSAVDECSRNSRYIYNNTVTGVRTEEPVKAGFEACMKEKGYR